MIYRNQCHPPTCDCDLCYTEPAECPVVGCRGHVQEDDQLCSECARRVCSGCTELLSGEPVCQDCRVCGYCGKTATEYCSEGCGTLLCSKHARTPGSLGDCEGCQVPMRDFAGAQPGGLW